MCPLSHWPSRPRIHAQLLATAADTLRVSICCKAQGQPLKHPCPLDLPSPMAHGRGCPANGRCCRVDLHLTDSDRYMLIARGGGYRGLGCKGPGALTAQSLKRVWPSRTLIILSALHTQPACPRKKAPRPANKHYDLAVASTVLPPLVHLVCQTVCRAEEETGLGGREQGPRSRPWQLFQRA